MPETTKIKIKGIPLKCSLCGKDEFVVMDTVVNEKWHSILDIEWANKRSKACVCVFCGHIDEFINQESDW